jgi:O-antigen/teichoic acid export membrane protein
MVVRHTLIYALARGGPAVLNFAALLLFARLLAPQEYGRYALLLAGVGLANATLFWWLQFGLLRFLPGERDRRGGLLSAIAFGYLGTVLLTFPFAGLLLFLSDIPVELALLGCVMLWTQSWHELNLELTRSDLSPVRYGLLQTARSVLLLGIGGGLAYAGYGAVGVGAGAAAAAVLPALLVLRSNWRTVRWRSVDPELVRRIAAYALPLTATSAMMLAVGSSDRFLLDWLSDRRSLGIYAGGHDLAQYSLATMMNVAYLASFPLALRALEEHGPDAARVQFAAGFTTMLAVGVPGAVGLALLAQPLATHLLGPSFAGAGAIIPWIALGTFLASFKAFYFDLSFQVGHATRIQLAVAVTTIAANVGMNLVMIPRWGAQGAAFASATSFGGGLLLSALLGRRAFPLPVPLGQAARVAGAAVIMALALVLTVGEHGLSGLVARMTLGAGVYAAAALALNVLGSRDHLTLALARGGRRGGRRPGPGAAPDEP